MQRHANIMLGMLCPNFRITVSQLHEGLPPSKVFQHSSTTAFKLSTALGGGSIETMSEIIFWKTGRCGPDARLAVTQNAQDKRLR